MRYYSKKASPASDASEFRNHFPFDGNPNIVEKMSTSSLLESRRLTEVAGRAPVFLLCSPGSGSNELCSLLAQHPHAYVTPGLNLHFKQTVGDLLQYRRSAHETTDGLLRTIAQLFAGEQTMDSIEMAKRWLRRRKFASSEDVMKELCEKVSPARLIDRWLFRAREAELLSKVGTDFPNAQFLHLTRHPVAQGMAILQSVEGIADLWSEESLDRSSKFPALDPQYAWFNAQATIMEFSDSLLPGQYLQIRIEEVMARPEDCLRKLCDWLELPHGIARRARDWPFASPGPYNAPGGMEWEPASDTQQLPDRPRTLSESLPWMKKKVGLAEPVKILAKALGY